MDIFYIDRITKEKKVEKIPSTKMLNWLYYSRPGTKTLDIVVKRKWASSFYGLMQSLPISKFKISKFVNQYGIDLSESLNSDPRDYKSFNHFFTRRLTPNARPICQQKNNLISPVDGKVMAYTNIDVNRIIQIKGFYFTLEELINDDKKADLYNQGTCLVFRLAPADYHRFHFFDWGEVTSCHKIKGSYYSVNPLALKRVSNLYCKNKREVTYFASDNFDETVMVEVGATCVGSIVQTFKNNKVSRGEEKGYFKFGGSTVILFFKKGKLVVDKDILRNSSRHLETSVRLGEKIGAKI
ncbi:phosphatidylserine decarboxylase [Proteinivorax tanatarense]|uniref:Phosphatidylserine decarboxylase proenzyme n=1 Tax=Proteinivorax tanatarense TaxID=1260629 RepID=A0AAU7VIR6_9FIRM